MQRPDSLLIDHSHVEIAKPSRSLLLFLSTEEDAARRYRAKRFEESQVCSVVDKLCPPCEGSECVLYDPDDMVQLSCAQQSLITFIPEKSLTNKSYSLDKLLATEEFSKIENFRTFTHCIIFCCVSDDTIKTALNRFILNCYHATHMVPVLIFPHKFESNEEIFITPTYRPELEGDGVEINPFGVWLEINTVGSSFPFNLQTTTSNKQEAISYKQEAIYWGKMFHAGPREAQNIVNEKCRIIVTPNAQFITSYFASVKTELKKAEFTELENFLTEWEGIFKKIHKFIYPSECIFYDAEFLRKVCIIIII